MFECYEKVFARMVSQNKSIHTTFTLKQDVSPNITLNYVLAPILILDKRLT